MKLAELARTIGARLLGDGEAEVVRIRAVDEASSGDLAFVSAASERRAAFTTSATAVLVGEEFGADHAHELPCAVLVSDRASRALVRAIDALYPSPARASGVDARAVVDDRASLGPAVSVGPLAVVGRATLGARVVVGPLACVSDDVVVGEDSIVGAGAVLLSGVRVGARVVIGPGTVLGDEGFVYAPGEVGDARNVAVRHIAGVQIHDDVEIGANACVDRGLVRDTRVGRGARIDNLAQIGHDVDVGEDAVIVAQVGVAGHARIGARAVLAGQVGVAERRVVGADARIGGQSGVTRDVPPGAAVSGMPAIPHVQWLRAMSSLKNLAELERRVRSLEQRLARAEPSPDDADPDTGDDGC